MRILQRIRGLCGYNANGEEIPDPVPANADLPFDPPIPLEQRIQQLLRGQEWNQIMEKAGQETFEEADDFDIPSDDTFDRATPYEDDFEPDMPGVIARHQEIKHGFVQERPIAKVVPPEQPPTPPEEKK